MKTISEERCSRVQSDAKMCFLTNQKFEKMVKLRKTKLSKTVYKMRIPCKLFPHKILSTIFEANLQKEEEEKQSIVQ